MHQEIHVSHNNQNTHKKTIMWIFFFKYLKKNLAKDVKMIVFAVKIAFLFLHYGLFTFLSGYTIFSNTVAKIRLVLFVGIVGVYCTLLPNIAVFILYFLPTKIGIPLLLLSVIFSFFIVFAI